MNGLKELLSSMQEAHLENSVTKLAIVAHGDTLGLVQLDHDLTIATIGSFSDEISQLGKYLTSDGKLLFVSCLAGGGREGATLLTRISRYLPGRTVIGFGINGVKPQEGIPALAGQIKVGIGFKSGITPARELKDMSYLDENTIFAKWAKDDRIVRVSDYDLADMLKGSWQVSSAIDDGHLLKSYKDAKAELSPIPFKKEIFITNDGKKLLEATYDPEIIGRTPKEINITYSTGSNRGKKSEGIFQFEPVDRTDFETLSICLAQPSKPRPKDFTASRGSKRLLLSLKYSRGRPLRAMVR